MSLLNNPTFDILRGYPNGSALAEPFPIKQTTPGVYESLPAGAIVTQELQNNQAVMSKATTPNVSIADPIQVWLVVEGNDDFSGQYTGMCMCVRLGTGFIWSTKTYTAGTYTPGVPVSFNAGVIKAKAVNEQIIGYVREDKTATEGKVVVAA
jgi:hypothetical protein